MNFDREAALKAGYTPEEIDAYLAQNTASDNFDREAARQAGYTDAEIDAYLAGTDTSTAPSALESAGQIAQQSAAGALTNTIKPMTSRERQMAKSVFVDPIVDVFTEQYLKPDIKTLYRVGGDVGLAMMGLPPVIAGSKALGAVKKGSEKMAESAASASARKSFAAADEMARNMLANPNLPEPVRQAVTQADNEIREKLLREYKKIEDSGVLDQEKLRELQNKVGSYWHKFFTSNKIPKEFIPRDLPKSGRETAWGALAEAALGPARAIGQRALKYGLGPAGAALTAKDISDAVQAGDYTDAGIQSALAGLGMIPGIGLPASLLGGLGYETYKHFADKPKLEFREFGGELDPESVTIVGENGPEIIHDNQVYGSKDGKLDLKVLSDLLGPMNAMATQATNTALMGLPEFLISLINPEEAEKYQQQRQQYPRSSETGEFLGDLSPQAKLKAALSGLGGVGLAGIAGRNLKDSDFFRRRAPEGSLRRQLEQWRQRDIEGSGRGPNQQKFLEQLNVGGLGQARSDIVYPRSGSSPFIDARGENVKSLNRVMNSALKNQNLQYPRDAKTRDMIYEMLLQDLGNPNHPMADKLHGTALKLGRQRTQLQQKLRESEQKLINNQQKIDDFIKNNPNKPVPRELSNIQKFGIEAYEQRKIKVERELADLRQQEQQLSNQLVDYINKR